MDTKKKQGDAHWGPLATASHQVGPNRDTRGTLLQTKRRHVENTSEICILRISAMSKLAPSQANVAAMSDRNGAFGRFWADMQNVQITAVLCTF